MWGASRPWHACPHGKVPDTASLFQGEREDAMGRVSADFEGVEAGVDSAIVGANPAISGRPDDSVTLPAMPSAVVKQTALTTPPRPEAAPITPPASSPRQVLVTTLTQTIAAAHVAGDLATAQIAARTLSALLSAPQQPNHVAPVVDLASARRARS
ncbi:hypothetical protein predicted by Glimmer/Critica [Sorangium cellulosum So ce56]|uniref:Uncharacterized protein n=2 Tax=Sorangium TaxID=39643 RepID=A9FPH7_SORC5|nr:hypothetical protein predicted by Glimmer/Critica [Sorangium cellulosum So ce56]